MPRGGGKGEKIREAQKKGREAVAARGGIIVSREEKREIVQECIDLDQRGVFGKEAVAALLKRFPGQIHSENAAYRWIGVARKELARAARMAIDPAKRDKIVQKIVEMDYRDAVGTNLAASMEARKHMRRYLGMEGDERARERRTLTPQEMAEVLRQLNYSAETMLALEEAQREEQRLLAQKEIVVVRPADATPPQPPLKNGGETGTL